MFGQIEEEKLTGKKSKTYHIGEYCCYGTVKVTVKRNSVLTVSFYNYKTTKLQEEDYFDLADRNAMMMYLEDNMSHYYADKIIKDFWI